MRLTVLSVGYPFAPISADPVGGAEQVLARLDAALVARGQASLVVAPEGSRPAGELLPLPAVAGEIGAADRARVHAALRARLAEVLASRPVDVVHLHGLDFDAYMPPPGPAVLVTLNLPLDWYAGEALHPAWPATFLHPVSPGQARTVPPGAILCARSRTACRRRTSGPAGADLRSGSAGTARRRDRTTRWTQRPSRDCPC